MPSVMYVSRAIVPWLGKGFSLISIGDPGQEDEFAKVHPGRLRLEFDDVEDYVDASYVMFDWHKANQLIAWLKEQGEQDIVVHCEGGISRSAGVAKFMIECMGYQLAKFHGFDASMESYNSLVYSQLKYRQLEIKIRQDAINARQEKI